MIAPTMIYKYPADEVGNRVIIKGVEYSYRIIDAHEIDDYLEFGWLRTPAEALDGDVDVNDEPPTRGELEIKADELGISYDGRTSDAKLLERINGALSELD